MLRVYEESKIKQLDGTTKVVVGVYRYDDDSKAKAEGYANAKEQADAVYHTKIAGAKKNADYLSELVMLFDNLGTQVKKSYYVRPEEEPSEE